MNFKNKSILYYLYFNFFIMKERLLALLEENSSNITEAIINEIIDDENPMDKLLKFDAGSVELAQCLEFEKDAIKFFNKHHKEIENIRVHLQQHGNNMSVSDGYSIKQYYAHEAFRFIAFELYMQLTIEDLL